jgi:RNA polymerase sigma factor (TIGR02999 family)
MARGQLARARRRHTFQPTDLVHEAFVRLVDQRADWQSRVHFYGIAATCMRRVLADHARRRKALKRPQVDAGVELDPLDRSDPTSMDMIVAVDEALERLSRLDPRQARVAELRVFTDLQVEEIASLLGIRVGTVGSRLNRARATLRAQLERSPG